jgi:hypothetical protein
MNISAFPTDLNFKHQQGMTLRDYFAAQAMQTALAYRRNQFETDQTDGGDWDEFFSIIAEESYTIANAMMKAREE